MATLKYDSQAVFVGPNVVTGNLATGDIKQLNRIQSTNYSIELTRENTMSLGNSFANDNIKEAPFVNLSMDYLVTNGQNEKYLGLVVDGEHGSALDMHSGDRDYFILIQKPSETPMVLSIGNGILMKYSVAAKVDDFLRASVDIRGFNIKLDQGTSGNYLPRVDNKGVPESIYTYALPAVQKDNKARAVGVIEDNIYVAARHLDISFPNNSAFGVAMSGVDKAHLQSFNLSLGLDRNELTRLGEKYPFKRCLQYPMQLTLSASVILDNFIADNIQNYFCQDDYDVEVDVKYNGCTNLDKFWETEVDKSKLKYILRGLKLKSFSSSDSIGDRKTVNLEWSVPVGNALDLRRNLFISGDFGRYLFPVDSFSKPTGQPTITGQGLREIVWETTYRRSKVDVEHPEFNLEFQGNFDTSSGDAGYLVYFQGDSGIAQTGAFGTQLSKSNYAWNSDAYSTIYDGLPASGFARRIDTFEPQYVIGYPGLFDKPSGQYGFYTKGFGFQTEPIEISFGNVPTWLDVSVDYSKFTIDPYKPFWFNTLNMNINAFEVPTGMHFDIQMIARNSKFKKIYTLGCMTPYSFNQTLPQTFKSRTSLFFNPYNEKRVQYDSSHYVTGFQESSLRATQFSSVSGSGLNNPLYNFAARNGKSYISFDSGTYLSYTGGLMQDFRAFTLFALHRPSSVGNSGAALIQFYQKNTGVLNSVNAAFFGQRGASQDFEFSYYNPTGTSGSVVDKKLIQGTSCWNTDNWNLTTVYYDGKNAVIRRSGVQSNIVAFGIPQSGSFSDVEIGANGYVGDIAEIILAPFALTSTELGQVESYLKYKWGF